MKTIVYTWWMFSWAAAFLSYEINKSILWAIFHWLCGGVYLMFRLVCHSDLLNALK